MIASFLTWCFLRVSAGDCDTNVMAKIRDAPFASPPHLNGICGRHWPGDDVRLSILCDPVSGANSHLGGIEACFDGILLVQTEDRIGIPIAYIISSSSGSDALITALNYLKQQGFNPTVGQFLYR